jgi:hypothetical protein
MFGEEYMKSSGLSFYLNLLIKRILCWAYLILSNDIFILLPFPWDCTLAHIPTGHSVMSSIWSKVQATNFVCAILLFMETEFSVLVPQQGPEEVCEFHRISNRLYIEKESGGRTYWAVCSTTSWWGTKPYCNVGRLQFVVWFAYIVNW